MGTLLRAAVARMGPAVPAEKVVMGPPPIVMVARRMISLPTLPAQVPTTNHRTHLARGQEGRPRHTHRARARATEVRSTALAAIVVGVEADLGGGRCPCGRGSGTMMNRCSLALQACLPANHPSKIALVGEPVVVMVL